MLHRRAFITLALSGGIFMAVALPAHAAGVQSKTVSGPNGSGTAVRFGGQGANSVTMFADDADGPGGRCTETWVDYSTKPHEHWNPGVFVNCSGGTRSVSDALTNSGKTITGMGVIICAVPDTSGPITRNHGNCRGDFGSMYLHSGQPYSRFAVSADQHPDGVQVYR